jgi:hypothetical protein
MRRFPKRRSARPQFEQLEDRNLMSIFGVPWPTGSLSLSFEPDGTSINGTGSNLNSSLSRSMPTGAWQYQILEAFQTWAVQTNLNIGLVSDGGQANGVAGGPTGDPRFGDIRIGGLVQPNATGLIETSPFSVLNGTWAGDSIVNTSDAFSIGGTSSSYDLFTAYLHDAGIALGLGNSPNMSSAMYEEYEGPRTGLSAEDIGNIQALYGAPQADPNNNSLSQATPLNVGQGVQTSGDISAPQDTDFYQLNGLQAGSAVAIRLQTQGISLFDGRITLFQDGQAIASMAPSSINQNIKFIIPHVNGNSTYSVEVQSGVQNVFGMGSYQLVVKPTSSADPTGDADIPVADNHSNDSFSTATTLSSQPVATASGYDYSYTATLSTSHDRDFYQLRSSQADLNRGSVMTVMVWTQSSTRVDPTATVYDQNYNLVPAQILVNQKGEYVLQITGATSSTYYVEVQAANPNGGHATGAYYLGVQFGDDTVDMDSTPAHSLTAANNTTDAQIVVADTRLIYFANTVTGSTSTDAARMTIFNQQGKSLASITASTGNTVTVSLLLTPGVYYVGFGGGQTNGNALSNAGVSFTLSTLIVSDPIDPDPSDPIGGAGGSSGTSSGGAGGSTVPVSPFDITPAPLPPLPPPMD